MPIGYGNIFNCDCKSHVFGGRMFGESDARKEWLAAGSGTWIARRRVVPDSR